jgi:flagellar biosynthesis anti-sigma factor FlgM
MKGRTTSRSARTGRQQQAAVAPVLESEYPARRDRAVSSMNLRAPQAASSIEQQPSPGGEGVDRAKVARLRRAIEAGGLEIDSQLIAQRLIDQAE